MAIHPDFSPSPQSILNPDIRRFPDDGALRESSYDKLLPPLVHVLRKKVKHGERDIEYVHINVAHSVRNVYLQAISLGRGMWLGTIVVGAISPRISPIPRQSRTRNRDTSYPL